MSKLIQMIKKYREGISYLVVGGLTTVVSLGTYYLCIYTFLDPAVPLMLQLANLISWIFAVSFSYVMNRKYVFQSHNPEILKEAASFFAGRVSTLLMEAAFMFIFVSVMRFNPSLMKLLDQILITVANYILSKLFVFKPHLKSVSAR